jgi:uncharacterized protein
VKIDGRKLSHAQDFLCRVFGDCVFGHILDREVNSMEGFLGPVQQKLFRYVRYNAELNKQGLAKLGCDDIDPAAVQKLDSIDAIPALERIGRSVAERRVDPAHFKLDTFRS